ncbi:36338_t:CDS:2, partial [Gigaspora margarita]
MTKEQLQQEIKEKVKEGVKPSDIKRLKRSRSLGDIPSIPNPELISLRAENQELKRQIQELEKAQEDQEIFVDVPEENVAELKDQILQLRIEKIKEFGEYYEKKQQLEKDLESNINYGTKEIQRLENKLKSINRKRLELQDQLGQSQSKNARLESQLLNTETKETLPTTPNCEKIKALESQIQSQPITDKSTEETLAELIKNIQDLNKDLDK